MKENYTFDPDDFENNEFFTGSFEDREAIRKNKYRFNPVLKNLRKVMFYPWI